MKQTTNITTIKVLFSGICIVGMISCGGGKSSEATAEKPAEEVKAPGFIPAIPADYKQHEIKVDNFGATVKAPATAKIEIPGITLNAGGVINIPVGDKSFNIGVDKHDFTKVQDDIKSGFGFQKSDSLLFQDDNSVFYRGTDSDGQPGYYFVTTVEKNGDFYHCYTSSFSFTKDQALQLYASAKTLTFK
jgi:hypothetical protein